MILPFLSLLFGCGTMVEPEGTVTDFFAACIDDDETLKVLMVGCAQPCMVQDTFDCEVTLDGDILEVDALIEWTRSPTCKRSSVNLHMCERSLQGDAYACPIPAGVEMEATSVVVSGRDPVPLSTLGSCDEPWNWPEP